MEHVTEKNYKQFCRKYVREVISFTRNKKGIKELDDILFKFCTEKKNHEGSCTHDPYSVTVATGIENQFIL